MSCPCTFCAQHPEVWLPVTCLGKGTSNLPCDKPFCNTVALAWQTALFGKSLESAQLLPCICFLAMTFFCIFVFVINFTGFKHGKNQLWQKGSLRLRRMGSVSLQ